MIAVAPGIQHRARRQQGGFTLMEVLVSIVVFAIAVVGLVAMEARSMEAKRASALLRDGERVAQQAMGELQAQGFLQLLSVDFAGNQPATLPYDDTPVAAVDRLRDFRRPPADQAAAINVVGSVRGLFQVFRTVDWVTNPADPVSANPPDLSQDVPRINALVLQVTVLWIDDSNPIAPPPANLSAADLTPAMADPTDPDFRPYVASVQLRTVRVNDVVL